MQKMTSENYVAGALRTDSPVTPEMVARFSDPETIRLIHATLGMVTEAAELADMLKKHLFYGRPIDKVNAAEELGDNQWYVGLAIDVLNTTMNDILTMNHEKLRLRYPEKFTEFCAENRDIVAERDLLEKHEATSLSQAVSARGQAWMEFSNRVLAHIEGYTVPQYGDKGDDQVSSWTGDDCAKQVGKYLGRRGKNARPGQEQLDLLKSAHYVQLTFEKDSEVVKPFHGARERAEGVVGSVPHQPV